MRRQAAAAVTAHVSICCAQLPDSEVKKVMNPETKNLFREKNLKKAADLEQLSGYLKVTGFSAWFVVIAAGLVLAAILIWFFFGKLQTIVKGAGYCQDGTIICYFPYDEIDNVSIGSKVDIEGHTGIVKDICPERYLYQDIPDSVLTLLPDANSMWFFYSVISCDLIDGLYEVHYNEDVSIQAPFMTREE